MFSVFKNLIQSKPSSQEIQANILAGLTVGVIALPLSMALAIASGVPPQQGLYTAIIGGIVIAVLGGSRVNISGPTAAFVVVLLPIVQQYGLGGLLISGLMAGIILVLMGVAKLGRLIEIVPYPVTVGFTAGIGVVIATFQIKDFLGLNIDTFDGHYLNKLYLIIQSLPTYNAQELLIGVSTLAVLLIWPKFRSRIPGHLIALLFGTILAWILTHFWSDFSVSTIGSRFSFDINGVIGQGIPPVIPRFEWPWNLPNAEGTPIGLSFDLFRELVPAAITIAVLGALESLLCAVVADGMSGEKHNPNDELIGQGIGNIIAPLFGGIPATAAIARTAANVKSGGTLPIASIVHAVFILVSILLLAPILSYIPMASMAALLMMVAWNMSEAKHFFRSITIGPKDDVIVLLLCFSFTVLFDMTIAVAIGMGLAAVLFIKRSIKLTQSNNTEHDHEGNNLPESIVLYDINGPLFFGTAQKALSIISAIRPEVQVVILDMSEVTMLDMSAIIAMESVQKNLHERNIGMVINNLEPRMILKLRRAGIRTQAGKIAFSRTLSEGIDMAKTYVTVNQ